MAHAGGGVIVEVGRGCSGDSLGQAVAVVVGVSGGGGEAEATEVAGVDHVTKTQTPLALT